MAESDVSIKDLLLEIKSEITSLKDSTNKNHEDLKKELFTFKTKIMTQMNAIDKAAKATNARQNDIKQEVDRLIKSQTMKVVNIT